METVQLNEDLANAPWTVGETRNAIVDQYDAWKTIFESVLDKHMPKKKMRVRQKDLPHMTEEWQMAIRNKRKYAQLFAQNRTRENSLQHRLLERETGQTRGNRVFFSRKEIKPTGEITDLQQF